jgi:tetratricopeptide (TPR) repeat protein
LTWRQSATYSDAETLYRRTIERNPDCWAAENNLGGELLDVKGDADGAIPHFEKSLQLKPNYRDAHYNLGQALLRKGKVEAAMPEARAALNLDPNSSDAHGLLGAVLITKGMVDDAIVQFSKALEIRPNNSEAQYDLAIALVEKHETADAVAHYEKAIEARPDYYKALTNLAWIFATSTDAALRRGPRAVELAEKANRVTGGRDPLVLRTLAAAYANDNRFGQALETSRRALQSAQAARDSELAEEIRREIAFYETGLPYRAP